MDTSALADAFRTALDANAFADVHALLHESCAYTMRGEVLHGPDAIVSSYREADERARRSFDTHTYASAINEITQDTATIEFEDSLTLDRRALLHHCRQRIMAASDGLIHHIDHIDLPGEAEAI